MTGAEHYAEAERPLDCVENAPDEAEVVLCIATAQVHATLALAAATAYPAAIEGGNIAANQWQSVIFAEQSVR